MTEAESKEPSELVRAYLSGAPSEVFSIWRIDSNGDRAEHKFRMRLLRLQEGLDAMTDAGKDAKRITGADSGRAFEDVYRELSACEVLRRSIVSMEPQTMPDGRQIHLPLFPDTRTIMRAFGENELIHLMNCHEMLKAWYGGPEFASEDELDLWISRLAGPLDGAVSQLAQLDSRQLPLLTWLLACRVKDYATQLGLTQFESQPSSESDQPSSTTPTSGPSGELPDAHSDSIGEIPNDQGQLSRETAREAVAKKRRRQAKKKR